MKDNYTKTLDKSSVSKQISEHFQLGLKLHSKIEEKYNGSRAYDFWSYVIHPVNPIDKTIKEYKDFEARRNTFIDSNPLS